MFVSWYVLHARFCCLFYFYIIASVTVFNAVVCTYVARFP